MRSFVLLVAIATVSVTTASNVFRWEIKDEHDIAKYVKTKEDLMYFLTEGVSNVSH